jgi:hypothetical protein
MTRALFTSHEALSVVLCDLFCPKSQPRRHGSTSASMSSAKHFASSTMLVVGFVKGLRFDFVKGLGFDF